MKLSQEVFMNQICHELKNTLFYDDHDTPLRSMTLQRPYPNKVTSAHAVVAFTGAGKFLLSVRRVK